MNTLNPGVDGVHGGVRPIRSTSFAVFSACTTFAGVKLVRSFVTLTNPRTATHACRFDALRFAYWRFFFPDASMSLKYCAITSFGIGTVRSDGARWMITVCESPDACDCGACADAVPVAADVAASANEVCTRPVSGAPSLYSWLITFARSGSV